MPQERGSPAFSGQHIGWPERGSRLYFFRFLGLICTLKEFLPIEFRIRIHEETGLLIYRHILYQWSHYSQKFKRMWMLLNYWIFSAKSLDFYKATLNYCLVVNKAQKVIEAKQNMLWFSKDRYNLVINPVVKDFQSKFNAFQ